MGATSSGGRARCGGAITVTIFAIAAVACDRTYRIDDAAVPAIDARTTDAFAPPGADAGAPSGGPDAAPAWCALTICGSQCVDTRWDVRHCGACDRRCEVGPNQIPSCSAAMCTTRCVDGFADCDREPWNGCETNVVGDPDSCGGCGVVCPRGPHARPGCMQPVCFLVCDPGYADCNGLAGDGCEHATEMGPCPT